MKAKVLSVLVFCLVFSALAQQKKKLPPAKKNPTTKEVKSPSADGLLVFADDSTLLYGYIDTISGQTKIPAQYLKAEEFVNNSALVQCSKEPNKGKWQLINAKGVPVVDRFFDNIKSIYNDLFVVSINNKDGIYNRAGKLLLPVTYKKIQDFRPQDGGFVLIISNDSVYSWFHESGLIYKSFYELSNNLYTVSLDKINYGLYDVKQKKMVLPLQYNMLFRFKNGYSVLKQNKKEGLINDSGRVVIPCIYDLINIPGSDGRIFVKNNQKCGNIDIEGKVIIPIIYDEMWSYTGNLVEVKIGNKRGLITKKGEVVLPAEYDIINDLGNIILFNKGGALINSFVEGGMWGICTKAGRVICKDKYNFVWTFKNKRALFVQGGVYNATNRTFDGGKYGYIDEWGTEIIPAQYDLAGEFLNGKATVKKNNKTFKIDLDGKEIISTGFLKAK